MRIVVAGGTGLIGRALAAAIIEDGHDVGVLTRRPEEAERLLPRAGVVAWRGAALEPAELAGADGVVNLAGASIGAKRWTKRRKSEILRSRVDSTSAIVDAIEELPRERRPRVVVNASGIDYAGDRGDDVVTEDVDPGESFLARVAVAWEEGATRAEPLGVRVVLMRNALVVSRDAPAFRLLVLPFRLFAGGPLGNGRQWFPWVHLEDAVALYRLAIERDDVRGPVNVVAPDVRRQRDVARELGRVTGRPAVFPAPAPLLRAVLGERADLLLHGQRAEPRKVLALGYRFRYPRLEEALAEALR